MSSLKQPLRPAVTSVAGLPSSFPSRPMYYSSALKRWLPVLASEMSPDGGSYAWVKLLPDESTQATFKTAELHRYEVATGTDQALWTSTVFFIVWRWDTSGVLVSVPPSGSNLAPAIWWLVNPVTGAATQQVSSSHASLYSFTPLAGDPTDVSFSRVGVDAQGHTIWWLFTNGRGAGLIGCFTRPRRASGCSSIAATRTAAHWIHYPPWPIPPASGSPITETRI